MEVPDLENGFMLLNHNRANCWQTRIEAVLTKTGNDGVEKYAHLSHDCRSEDVSEDPFGRSDEFYLGISTWSGNYIMGGGSSLLKANPKYRTRPTDNTNFVSCVKRDSRLLEFDEVLSNLQNDYRSSYSPIYTELTFARYGATYRVYTPCRYLNYPNSKLESKKYLQPISGHVLFEEEEQFYLAYVVAYIADGKTKTIQFRLSEQTDFFKTIAHPGKKLKWLIKFLPTLLYTTGYQRVVTVEDKKMQCRFFEYL